MTPLYLPICGIYLSFQVNLHVPNSKPSNDNLFCMPESLMWRLGAVSIFHARWVILTMSGLRSSFTRKWLVIGMPSPMLKSNQNKLKQNSPRIIACMDGTRCFGPAVECACWLRGGGKKTLPFCLGTAYNVCSMEDIEISWLLCWQWKHTAQNHIHLCFKKTRALAPLQIPASLCDGPIYLL
jgi:hypothetical protein